MAGHLDLIRPPPRAPHTRQPKDLGPAMHPKDPLAPARFEGSYLGDRSRLGDAARLECKICWWVYDPELGDPQWQIPPGTPFSALPGHWRCPQCDGDAEQFMVLD